MDPATQTGIGEFKLLLDFIERNLWPLVVLVFLVVARKGIGKLVERIIKVHFKWGSASGGVEVAAPMPPSNDDPRAEAHPQVSQPATTKSGVLELKEKDEEANDWFVQMHQAFLEGNSKRATELFEAHRREEADADSLHSNEAFYLYFLYKHGNNDAALLRLEKLHATSANAKQRGASISWLSACYEAAKDYNSAEKLWEEGLPNVTDEEQKTSFITSLVNVYKKNSKIKLGIELLEDRLLDVEDSRQRATLYHALSNLEKDKGDGEAAAIALEKAVEFSPGNRETLFDTAYAQGQQKLQLLSAANYLTLLNLDNRHATALNNLGVYAGNFELPGKEISLYRRSMDEKSTLAMANFANRLINAGFLKEAKEILDKARVMDDPHENVGNALYRLQKLQNSETDKWSKLTQRADTFQRQVRKYGDGLFDGNARALDCGGAWYTEQGIEVNFETDGERVAGEWVEVLDGLIGGTSSCKCAIDGTRRNRGVRVTYRRRSEAQRASTLLLGGSTDKSIQYFSYLTIDHQEWRFFSIEPKDDTTMTLYRKTPN